MPKISDQARFSDLVVKRLTGWGRDERQSGQGAEAGLLACSDIAIALLARVTRIT